VLRAFYHSFCDLLFPHNCIFCKKYLPHTGRDVGLCPDCQNAIKKNVPPFCQRCSRHLLEPAQGLCPDCLHYQPHFDCAWGATYYNDMMKRLVHLFKYGNKTALRHHFSHLIFSFMESYQINARQFDMIAPIPLHPARFRERGYNQSQILADSLARKFSLPVSLNNLIRTRNTRNQAHLGQKERWTNIKAAFRIKRPSEFQGKTVLIVDDLMTTGATASEASRVLKETGARKVGVLTLAITH